MSNDDARAAAKAAKEERDRLKAAGRVSRRKQGKSFKHMGKKQPPGSGSGNGRRG